MEQETVLVLFDRYADMVYRIALSYLRSPQEAEDVVQTVAISLDEVVLSVQPENRDIVHAVMELPEKYRAVVSLHYFEGYSFREISKFLHISISAVSMRLYRAKSILKKQLGGD